MGSFQIFTIAGFAATALLGIINLVITLKNRRNSLREHVFKEQLTFLLELRQKLSILEIVLEDLNKPWSDNKTVAKNLMACLNDLDQLQLSKNILLPHKLYIKVADFMSSAFSFCKKVISNPESITKEEEKRISDEIFDLEEEFREHIVLDELTEENRRITTGRFKV